MSVWSALTERFNPPTEKKRCCHTAVSGLVMDHPTTRTLLPPALRRSLGLFILVSAHVFTTCWLAIMSVFRPRYRHVLRFQRQYFRDVLARELHPPAPACAAMTQPRSPTR